LIRLDDFELSLHCNLRALASSRLVRTYALKKGAARLATETVLELQHIFTGAQESTHVA